MKRSKASLLFDIFNHSFLGLVSLMAMIPFIYILIASITPPEILLKERFILIPKGFSLEAYGYVLNTSTITHALLVSICLTVTGTLFNLAMTVLFAYPLSHQGLYGRSMITFMVVFTMMFSGGILPTYMVVRQLGLIDTYASLILPGSISTFNLIIFRNFFQSLPAEIEESAKIDGANYPFILSRIILPLSVPLLATFAVMYGVGIWNSWFSATLYLNSSDKWPIQVVLRQIINLATRVGSEDIDVGVVVPQQSVRMVTIIITITPILLVYPFLQRYFTKGILMGSIKG
ncbi:MAG TPA: carbohydrate ABC transporter permease [Candidatus Limiplasma sp.]|nr:carbohydrate ABC transporter permease [Candidatus Limiplasma sp.]